MRILGLVTARGGSKGFPGKNLAALAGRPLVVWAHRALAEARRRWSGELLLHLSTDDATIVAAWPEADRPQRLRPAALAEDHTSSLDVVRHELAAMSAAGRPCDGVLLLQPTSPLLSAEDLLALLAALDAGAASALCVAPTPHPPAWSLAIVNGAVVPGVHESAEGRRQDRVPTWLPCGAWACRSQQLADGQSLVVHGQTQAVCVSPERAIDIDGALDLRDAEARLPGRRQAGVISIGAHRIGGAAPCFIIAEAGVNHDGDPAEAHRLIDAAAEAGADCVKFQTFRADALVTASAPTADYQQRAGAGGDQRAMLAALELPASVWAELQAHACERGLLFLSTPFDAASADLLASLNVPAFKLGSGELTNGLLIQHVAAFGRPLLLSTGMADLDECQAAQALALAAGAPAIAWFHCVSQYPAPAEAANLRAIDTLRDVLGGPVGWSDHSVGHELTVAAVARGAKLIEKHLTRDRGRSGPDHAASLDPTQFAELVRALRLVESALGDGVKRQQACEADVARVARRSLVAARDLSAGAVVQADDLVALRPGTGLSPMALADVVGRPLRRSLAAGSLLDLKDLG